MKKKARNPDEYVFYEGIENIHIPNVNFDDDLNDRENKFSKFDGLKYIIDNDNLEEEFDDNNRERLLESLHKIFDTTKQYNDKVDFQDFLNDNKFIFSGEEEYRQKNFKDYLELKYETKSHKYTSNSSLIPFEFLEKSSEKVEIQDDPSKLTGQNKHRSTVLIKKDDEDIIKGIQVICSCGERINISFDYNISELSTQSEYEEQSPRE